MKLILLFLICVFSNLASAQWSANTSINNMVVNASGNQLGVKTISDGDFGIIMVWEDQRNGGSSNRDVYAQRIDKFGVKQWGDSNGLPIAIKPVTERYYDICSDGKGGAIILWDDNPLPTVTYLKGQRISKSGQKLWSDTGKVIAYDGFRQSGAKIISNGNGGCFIAYQSSELNSSDFDLKANMLDSNGNKLWGNGVWFCQLDGNQYDLVAIKTSDNNYVVSWRDGRTGKVTELDIFAQKISSTGSVMWTANGITVCNARFTQEYQDMYPDNSGGFYIAWCDRRDSIQIDIYAQRFRANGTNVFTANGIPVCLSPESQFRPYFTTDMKGGVICTWNDFRNGPSAPFNIDIYAQRFDSNGVMKWVTNGVQVCNALLSQNNQSILSDGNYGAVIAWDDRRNGTSVYEIFAQRIDSSGNLLWDTNDVAVSLAAGNQYRPLGVVSNNGFIFSFEDTRQGLSNYDVYAMKITLNGTLVNIKKYETINLNTYTLSQNYPNPFNPETTIEFSIPESQFTELIIYDISGRQIEKLVSGNLNAGFYTLNFKSNNLSSGIYFYRLITNNNSITKKLTIIK
ncbi:MAG: T9SS type A sorting domain-containing protein [Ignavibacteria bacterium]|nr:T9SS type A sorting domain-containing protein [Ignavibacteria bacterium]